MSKILKNKFLKASILLLFFVISSQLCVAEENVPLLPMTVQGIALIDGAPAPSGTIITAYIDENPVEKFIIESSSGSYCLWISGTAEDEGKPITFTVNGKSLKKSLVWKSGNQILDFELSVGKTGNSLASNNPSISNVNSNSITGTENSELPGEDNKVKVIENLIPEPDLKIEKNKSDVSSTKESAGNSRDSSILKSTPGFPVIDAFAAIFLIAFKFGFGRKSRRKI